MNQRAPVHALVRVLAGDVEIVEYVERAVSGAAPLDERDVLRALLRDAEPGDLVAAFDLSRLTRSDDWSERYRVLGALRTSHLRPATVEDGEIDLTTLGGRITTHIRGEVAADEAAGTEDDDVELTRIHAPSLTHVSRVCLGRG
jgi:DNA invertase Pin-like site-specific DNA recombinase